MAIWLWNSIDSRLQRGCEVNRRTVFAMLRVSGLLLVGVSADVQQEWKDFKIKYGKQYNGIDEEGERAAIFSKNYEYIFNTNAQNLT